MNIEQPDKNEYWHSKHIVHKCIYHVIWTTKYRRKLFNTNEMQNKLREILYDVAQKRGFEIIEAEIMEDHIHCLIQCNPQFGITKCVSLLKGNTSRIMRQTFPSLKSRISSLWTHGKFISSVGCVSLETVKKYIDGQKGK